jgi:cytochrome c-type biogenesis protein CcmH
MIRTPLLIVLTCLFAAGSFFAADLAPELENEAKAIEGLLIAPCCWRQPVSVHFSPAADEVKADIRQLLSDGLGRQEILDKYVAEYGERILAKPPASGFNLLAYFLPTLFLLVGGVFAVAVFRKLRTSDQPKAAEAKPSRVDSSYAAKLDKEMWG